MCPLHQLARRSLRAGARAPRDGQDRARPSERSLRASDDPPCIVRTFSWDLSADDGRDDDARTFFAVCDGTRPRPRRERGFRVPSRLRKGRLSTAALELDTGRCIGRGTRDALGVYWAVGLGRLPTDRRSLAPVVVVITQSRIVRRMLAARDARLSHGLRAGE